MAQKSSEARSLDLVRVFLAEHALRLHDAQNLLDWGGLQELENWMRFMASRHHMAVRLGVFGARVACFEAIGSRQRHSAGATRPGRLAELHAGAFRD